MRCDAVQRVAMQSFNDKKNYIDDVTDADFYKCIELNSSLPGASQLQVLIISCRMIAHLDSSRLRRIP